MIVDLLSMVLNNYFALSGKKWKLKTKRRGIRTPPFWKDMQDHVHLLKQKAQ